MSQSCPRPEPFTISETPVEFDASGALWLPRTRTLVFADLHFEKGSSFAGKGIFLPPYDTRRTLRSVAATMDKWQPETVISLGDAFHDDRAEARMDAADLAILQQLTAQCRWIWILGNHDPAPPKQIDGEACEDFVSDGLLFTHAPCPSGNWHVAGHYHPAAKVSGTGRNIRRRCFMSDGERLILPPYGAYTGGLNVLDPVYKPYFRSGFSVFLLGEDQVWQVPSACLRPDS